MKATTPKRSEPKSKPLTALMLRGARLEAVGRSPTEVAKLCKVKVQAVYRWHMRPDYREAVSAMVAEINERAKEQAATLRALAAEVGAATLRKALAELERERDDEDGLSASNLRDLSTVGKDWYGITSGQTGLASKLAVEISAGPDADEEADAAAKLLARLRDGR